MMRRYFTIPSGRYSPDLDCECPDTGMTHTVHEPESVTRKTGLIDKQGNPIMVREETGPIGFVRFTGEW